MKLWELYGNDRLCEAVDPILQGNFPAEEACRVLQVGLLCIQASAELRPPMTTVVKMLTGDHAMPRPTQPPFLNSNSEEIVPLIRPGIYDSSPNSNTQSSGNAMSESWIEPR